MSMRPLAVQQALSSHPPLLRGLLTPPQACRTGASQPCTRSEDCSACCAPGKASAVKPGAASAMQTPPHALRAQLRVDLQGRRSVLHCCRRSKLSPAAAAQEPQAHRAICCELHSKMSACACSLLIQEQPSHSTCLEVCKELELYNACPPVNVPLQAGRASKAPRGASTSSGLLTSSLRGVMAILRPVCTCSSGLHAADDCSAHSIPGGSGKPSTLAVRLFTACSRWSGQLDVTGSWTGAGRTGMFRELVSKATLPELSLKLPVPPPPAASRAELQISTRAAVRRRTSCIVLEGGVACDGQGAVLQRAELHLHARRKLRQQAALHACAVAPPGTWCKLALAAGHLEDRSSTSAPAGAHRCETAHCLLRRTQAAYHRSEAAACETAAWPLSSGAACPTDAIGMLHPYVGSCGAGASQRVLACSSLQSHSPPPLLRMC